MCPVLVSAVRFSATGGQDPVLFLGRRSSGYSVQHISCSWTISESLMASYKLICCKERRKSSRVTDPTPHSVPWTSLRIRHQQVCGLKTPGRGKATLDMVISSWKHHLIETFLYSAKDFLSWLTLGWSSVMEM